MNALLIEYLTILSSAVDSNYTFSVEPGRKYYKVTQAFGDRGTRSVHSFVDKETLDVYKPAGWKRPAKGVRYNLYKDMALLEKVADPYGSYLYR